MVWNDVYCIQMRQEWNGWRSARWVFVLLAGCWCFVYIVFVFREERARVCAATRHHLGFAVFSCCLLLSLFIFLVFWLLSFLVQNRSSYECFWCFVCCIQRSTCVCAASYKTLFSQARASCTVHTWVPVFSLSLFSFLVPGRRWVFSFLFSQGRTRGCVLQYLPTELYKRVSSTVDLTTFVIII